MYILNLRLRYLKPINVANRFKIKSVIVCLSDIWSLGVILYMLVCGHPPFQEANDSETLIMIMDCRYTVPNHVSPECKEYVCHPSFDFPQAHMN